MPVRDFIVESRGVGRKDYSVMVEYSTEPAVRSHQSDFHHCEMVTVPANYTVGDATFTIGSTTVTGVGTNWVAAMVGRRIKNNTETWETWFIIQSVESPTQLTLIEAYYVSVAATTGAPVAYTLGGKVIEVAVPSAQVVMLYDFIATRPNNKLIRMQVESIDLVGVVGLVVDETHYQTTEKHLSKGMAFLKTIRFIIFNYDTEAEPYMKITCNGFYTSTQEHYLSVSGAPGETP